MLRARSGSNGYTGWSLLAIMAATVALLAGCGSPGAVPQGAGDGAAASGQPEATPQRGGVFQQIPIRDLPHLHPWTNTASNTVIFLGISVYGQLVQYDYKPFEDHRKEYRVVPSLAERWDLRDDTVYTFHLRRNVKWHDGQPFTAHDVKWSYDFLADPANKLLGGPNLSTIASISVLDDFTVQIVTKAPDVEFLGKLTETLDSILPKHLNDRGHDFERVAVGTGPYKIESFARQGGGVSYVPNKEYWKPEQPYLDKWKILPAADDATRIAAFIARQNDVLKVPNRLQAEAVLAQVPEAKHAPFLRDNASEVSFKLDKPPFNDLRVRQAIHLGIDRREMLSTLTLGDGLLNPPGLNAINNWAIPSRELETLPGWRTPKDQDNARAKQLLAEAGHPTLTFTLRVDRATEISAEAEMIGEQLRKLGINARLQPMESATYAKALTDGDYEAFIDSSSTVLPERRWRQRLHSQGVQNAMPIIDPDLDRLIDAQARELDPTKRKQLFEDVQRLLLRQVYAVPLITKSAYFAWQPYVHGWADNHQLMPGSLDWGQLWLDVALVPKGRQ